MLIAATPKKAGIDRFRSDGCKCQFSGGEPCHTLFTATQIRAACDKRHQLTHDQLDRLSWDNCDPHVEMIGLH